MSHVALRAEHLSKKFRIGSQLPYHRFSELLLGCARNLAAAPGQWLSRRSGAARPSAKKRGEFWALKDVSFEVKQGEVVGIIGRNGAGKSTLLKILSRITEPSSGRFGLRGRVGSLLEVGTGFHPELTGRENIFLSGCVLGMSRRDIRRRFDEIVDFAGIEEFLDTPVKHYSSGMYVRLGFAIAAHLEPEILVVDEVLAIGDAEFQRKCLGRMRRTAGSGRTVLFVSHDLAAVQQLCNACILLQRGEVAQTGPASEVAASYLASCSQPGEALINLRDRPSIAESSRFRFTQVGLRNAAGVPTSHLDFGEPFQILLEGYVERSVHSLRLGFAVNSALRGAVFNSFQTDYGLPGEYAVGPVHFRIRLDDHRLAPGVYELGLGAIGEDTHDLVVSALTFQVDSVPFDSARAEWRSHSAGTTYCPCNWQLVPS
jgi:lipopolysaccharide transport system ATP-binding protein